MSALSHIYARPTIWRFDRRFDVYLDQYKDHLVEQGYAPKTVCAYTRCVAHFSYWASQRRQAAHSITDADIERFLTDSCMRVSNTSSARAP